MGSIPFSMSDLAALNGEITLTIGACLVLVVAEVAVGSNHVIGGLFFFSIPLLVAVLTWVNKGIVFDRAPRTLASVVVLGLSVLVVSSLIILVGLLAAANLKALMIGA